MENKQKNIEMKSTFSFKVIYIFRINNSKNHKGILKIGEASLNTNLNPKDIPDNSNPLNEASKKRIREYTNTIGVQEELLYSTLAIKNDGDGFRDKDVHRVLDNSGYKKHKFKNDKNPMEWYEVDLETAKNAIKAVKEDRSSLNQNEKSINRSPIEFRPEQIQAIEKTLKTYKTRERMLWNAKMRFGKTLSALEVIKRMSKDDTFKLKKAIIITHRPVVDKGWFEDFDKIFCLNEDEFKYGSKNRVSIKELEKEKTNYVYFASIQDLRGSQKVGGKFEKNDEVFGVDWDLIVIDEAHEGTQTELGKNVYDALLESNKEHTTRTLQLSGTPFNLLDQFEQDEIFTWDYVMEQKAKLEWEKEHPLDYNPYDELPRLNILTYDLKEHLKAYQDNADNAFNFKEFFRVYTEEDYNSGIVSNKNLIGEFVHKTDVQVFLNLLIQESDNNYPFSKQEYRDNFRHSFWILPGIKEAKALKKLMLKTKGFDLFTIVNVAGKGDDNGNEPLTDVEDAIGDNPMDTYTITLSCGKLTTGVTVKPWTAVLYLSGSYQTKASGYLQTIFRVQSPANIGGRQKRECYVFDFAPDRTLKMVAQAGRLSIKAGDTSSRLIMEEFLNFCPIISAQGSEMVKYDVEKMLIQLKQAYVERVVENGFDDVKIYNDELLKLDDLDIQKFEELKKIIGSSKQKGRIDEIEINDKGFDKEEWERIRETLNKKKKDLTKEDKERLEELKKKKDQKQKAISILRGISIRIPLMMYGADIKDGKEITVDNFTDEDIIDNLSWEEFMPNGVTKEKFKEFSKYYDKEIFLDAGKKIRRIAKYADELEPTERTKEIANLFKTFKNPDKETVLTPWRVVNMHMSDTIGGYSFWNSEFKNEIEEPRFVKQDDITDKIFKDDGKILEINSKTGLYPLYITYSMYRHKLSKIKNDISLDKKQELWDNVLKDNVYVVCKTPMAKSITKRTLTGFRNAKIHAHYFEDLINMISNKQDQFIEKIKKLSYWNVKGVNKEMEFDAIVGNPPYQENISKSESNSSLGKQLFPYFIISAIKTEPHFVSLITPSRWFSGDAQDKSFIKLRDYIKSNNHFRKIVHFKNYQEIFNNVVIKGGVSYFLNDKNYTGNVEFNNTEDGHTDSQTRKLFEDDLTIILSDTRGYNIIKKVTTDNFVSMTTITKGRNAFGIVGKESVLKSVSTEKKEKNSIEIRCKENKFRYTTINNITKNNDLVNKYKVFISKSAGDPLKDKKVISKGYVGFPRQCCTDSLIPIGNFDNELEAVNLQKYLTTKFVRYMISLLKVSQNVYQNVYQFVPTQDFTNKSDINWDKPSSDIDKQLYKKYKLSKEEIDYIENNVQEI